MLTIISLSIYRSIRGNNRYKALIQADSSLDKAIHYLRLCQNWGWLNQGQYQHAVNFVAEIGRLLGGWIKQSAS